MQWKGPYEVTEKVGASGYKVKVNGKEKLLHANLLKKYIPRDIVSPCNEAGLMHQVCASIMDTSDDDHDRYQGVKEADIIQYPEAEAKETIRDIQMGEELNTGERSEIEGMLRDYEDVLTDIPGRTNLVKHKILLTTKDPVRSKPYPAPFHLRETMKEEIEKMLKMDVIEQSTSDYASPVVLARKPDGSVRFCIDFRGLNKVYKFDAEPMPNTDELFGIISKSKYFSKIDLSKGFWQIELEKDSRPYTAFVTSEGLYQFKVMPFGLLTSPATFSRMMRKLLAGMPNVVNFIDDILVHTETLEEHLSTLRELFERLRKANLKARPSLVGYYRKFIPNFAAIASPLTDLTKKGLPNKVTWGPSQENSFLSLKGNLTSSPILAIPDFMKSFILRTDASDKGIGAILLQERDGNKFPVAYASKKLLQREQNYSVIERECLAIVWAVMKFQSYLYGQEFLLETDHAPLVYLRRSKLGNSRLMRWALFLQTYKFRIIAIKGKDNVGADYLSRLEN
ncbi:hypothetical protein FSP39_009620 [Pinctada imbricata]|uniref:Reverse transcriptase domain-containing protein n=1 Tax=Pinctada imbricata TaxID=66713 RepID=A0AA88XEZ2_PINIB|nr:hypothetical protein FSP39_009620 [Pinctada imbricata]